MEWREKIVKELKKKRQIIEDNTDLVGREAISPQFIRGFISGANDFSGADIPTHWYEGMVEEVLE